MTAATHPPCPTCGHPLPLLALCDREDCRAAAIAEDHRHARLEDQ